MDRIEERTFGERDIVYQIGNVPRRIDILTGIDGIGSMKLGRNRMESSIGKTPDAVIGRDDLIEIKGRAVARKM